ncbi:hypothetical protein BDM02DRAFT_3185491 [Thelephora ganbajun]|uniref:Uncharacterized protein n=1 Tax=Thelephora ganbajun TaxID=370292 RepID=A0ACB6ZLT1_THEGA|nr:hypothetical protein BDM02DRAFT_3185491 [Thelephora ganbajun]
MAANRFSEISIDTINPPSFCKDLTFPSVSNSQAFANVLAFKPHQYQGKESDGSPSSGPERKEVERPSSASYMSNNTDDDDISVFIQDIDACKPLQRALLDHQRYPLGVNPE